MKHEGVRIIVILLVMVVIFTILNVREPVKVFTFTTNLPKDKIQDLKALLFP